MTQREILPLMCLAAMCIGITVSCTGYCQRHERRKTENSTLYKRAEQYAVTEFGDKHAPLTSEEKEAWYSSMGVSKYGIPSKGSLEEYLNEHLIPSIPSRGKY